MLQGCLWPPGVMTDLHSRTAGAVRKGLPCFYIAQSPSSVTTRASLHPAAAAEGAATLRGVGTASFLLHNLQLHIQRAGGLAAVLPGSFEPWFTLKSQYYN